MANYLNDLKSKIKESENPKNTYVYKRVLDVYNNRIKEILGSEISLEEKENLHNVIDNLIKSTNEKISLLKDDDFQEVYKLKMYISDLEMYRNALDNNYNYYDDLDLIDEFSLNLGIFSNSQKRIILRNANNGYEAAVEKKIAVDNDASNEMEEDNSHIVEGLVWIGAGVLLTALTSGMYLFYGAVLYGLYKLLFGKRNN